MRLTELVRDERRARLSPLKARLLEYLEAHPDEVFPYRDQELAKALGMKTSALSFTLWALQRDGLVGKVVVAGKTYFGSRKAVEELRRQLGRGGREDAFGRAQALRESIKARAGTIDVLELLDAVRGPWG